MKLKSKKTLAVSACIVFVLVALDQITKYLAVLFLKGKDPFVLIPGVFELRYLENQSAAFGIDFLSIIQNIFHFSYFEGHPQAFLTCKMVFFVILTLAVVVFLFYVYRKIPGMKRYLYADAVILAFCAGAIGNCIDRFSHQYVIDFFYFKLIDFPIFNVADIYVTVSAVSLILLTVFYYKETDYEAVFPPKKKKEDI